MKRNYYILSNEIEGNICVINVHYEEDLESQLVKALTDHFDEVIVINNIEKSEYDSNYAKVSVDVGEYKQEFELNKTWVY